MPGHSLHAFLTRKTIEALPETIRDAWTPRLPRLCEEFCGYPDRYYATPEPIAPYLCFTDGVPFHYPPNEEVLYNHWEVVPSSEGAKLKALALPVNQHHRHCRRGFEFYFRKISAALEAGQGEEAAKFFGAISHMLQDNTTPGHGFEGMDGSDIMVFNRYVRPPEDRMAEPPTRIFSEMQPVALGDLAGPGETLGGSVEEAAFLFYTRFCQTVAENRFAFLPLLHAAYAEDQMEWDRLLAGVFENTILLNATFLMTCHALAGGMEVTPRHSGSLLLSDLRPCRQSRYLSAPYRHLAMLRNASLNPHGESCGLELEPGPGQCRRFEQGLGMGGHAEFFLEHELPGGLYSKLIGMAGLHARWGREGKVRLQWELGGKVLWQETFQGGRLADSFEIPVSEGGLLRFRGFAMTESPLDQANHVVLAEPRLVSGCSRVH